MMEIPGILNIPDNELRFTFSRSSGPGGQNVNKVNSRVTLWFDVKESSSLTELQKNKIRSRLANRINEAGILSITSTTYRTQRANREDAVQRFQALIAAALTERPVRKKTKIPRRIHEKRLQVKKRRGMIKSVRAKKHCDYS
ncbi:MAG: alternative ribosome rescue aminoacyl-tRNA hydrolase ArfB [Desulfobulbaceae bacterium]|nr:alternative ribosome rescue aminoacyl-tRNA hydrolase ArfB [Desulfobulbaceae bacterium]